jgi:hypothetical protein
MGSTDRTRKVSRRNPTGEKPMTFCILGIMNTPILAAVSLGIALKLVWSPRAALGGRRCVSSKCYDRANGLVKINR